jgi:hypothetical protein
MHSSEVSDSIAGAEGASALAHNYNYLIFPS